MHISGTRRRLKYFFLFLSILILIYFILPRGVSFIISTILGNNIRVGDLNLSFKGCSYSVSKGVILKNVSLKSKEGKSSIARVYFKKGADSKVLFLENGWLNLTSLSILETYNKASNSEREPLKIYLKKINFRINKKNTLKIENAFIWASQRGINWYFNTSFKLFNLNLRGYSSKSGDSLFVSNLKPLGFVLAGFYDFKDKTLSTKFYRVKGNLKKSPVYSFKTGLEFTRRGVALKNISFAKLYIPGPVFLNPEKVAKSDWSISNSKLKAKGDFSFKFEKNFIKSTFRILGAYFSGYKFITNYYFNYDIRDRILKFNSGGTVLNNRPFPELSFVLRFSKDGVFIDNLEYQGGFSLKGYLDYNRNISLKGEFKDFSLFKLISLAFPLYSRYIRLDSVSGELNYFSYNGIELVEILWNLSKGSIWNIAFQSGKIHLVGDSNVLGFVNSELLVNNKPVGLEGKIDFGKFPHPEMWENVRLVPLSPALPWGEFSYSNRFGDKSFSFGTKLKDNVNLKYNVEFSGQDNYNKNEVSLELKGKPNLNLRMREDEEILDFEKKVKF